MHRRQLLASAASLMSAFILPADAMTIYGAAPAPTATTMPPVPVIPGAWMFFTAGEARAVDAIAARLIPADRLGPGAHEAGCAVFIDRQLAGPYGDGTTLYLRPPFASGTPEQGPQTASTPAQHYRAGLAALDRFCVAAFVGRGFAALAPVQQDAVLTRLEGGLLGLGGISEPSFFALLLKNTREGFLSDPIYGGNRGMVGWALIGFPGARYDYRAEIAHPGQALTLPPVGLLGRDAWHTGTPA